MSKNGLKSSPEPKNVPWVCKRPHWPAPKHIAAVELGGYIFLERLKGVGKSHETCYWSAEGDADVVEEWDEYVIAWLPVWDADAAKRDGVLEAIKALDAKVGMSTNPLEDYALLLKYIMRPGKQEGYEMLRADAQGKPVDPKKIVLQARHCWETGLTYLQFLRGEEFEKFKELFTYHGKEIEEEGDWKGWYCWKADADELTRRGYDVHIYDL